ncbi:SDR family oxidoreductase [Patescibacteria group bacterium]
MNLNGKTILITGSSEGIGKEIALLLAKKKTKLILLSRNSKELKIVSEIAKKEGAIAVEIIECDLRDKNQINKAVEKIENIDCLINNAGIWQKVNDLDKISEEETLDVISTNLTGLILITQKLLPKLKKSKEAAIINISSRSGYSAQKGQSIYSATKYGVRGFTEVLREDLKETSIRVAGVYQGGTNTNMFKKVKEGIPEEAYKKFIPPKELAEVVAFMLTRPKYTWLPEVRIESK